jgi:hypothetical protein
MPLARGYKLRVMVRLCWYAFLPCHQFLFNDLIGQIEKELVKCVCEVAHV